MKIIVTLPTCDAAFNHLLNSIRAMSANGETLRVSSSREDNNLQLKIVHTGCGMSEAQVKKVFAPFYHYQKLRVWSGVCLMPEESSKRIAARL
ncbi:MAG TPA: ATP-binding protein [Pyrinomonadaceae bacterium]|jgi:signal transduction histidine kinase|nr:ATP-binding protein [Pyrinomonadaceae bacterium]